MNQTTFKYACLFCITTLFLVSVPAQSYAQAPAGLMQKEFDALSAYEFGMSREPVYRIFEAVHAAVAGHPEGNYTVQDLEMRLVETLQKEISPEAKDYICRMLGEIGGSGSVEALASQFGDKEVFPAALVALEQNKTGEAAAALDRGGHVPRGRAVCGRPAAGAGYVERCAARCIATRLYRQRHVP